MTFPFPTFCLETRDGPVVNAVSGVPNASLFKAGKASSIIATDEAKGILSVWIKPNGFGTGPYSSIFGVGYLRISMFTVSGDTSSIRLETNDSALSKSFGFDTNELVPTDAWSHILMTWDTNQTAGNKKKQVYVNGVSATYPSVNDSSAAFSNYVSATNPMVGSSQYAGQDFDGAIAEFYLNLGEDLDLSITANREKFRTPGGYPVDLGSNGSLPTGSVPEIYLKNPAASWGTNSGSGGTFTVTGTISDVSGP